MVKHVHAAIRHGAVLGPEGPHDAAGHAQLVPGARPQRWRVQLRVLRMPLACSRRGPDQHVPCMRTRVTWGVSSGVGALVPKYVDAGRAGLSSSAKQRG